MTIVVLIYKIYYLLMVKYSIVCNAIMTNACYGCYIVDFKTIRMICVGKFLILF